MISETMAENFNSAFTVKRRCPRWFFCPACTAIGRSSAAFARPSADQVRFVEFTYPRTLTWSLDDYAAAIETALAQNGITGGWLLGESYGSQVLWAMVARGKFTAQGVILAGGFVKHPLRWAVRLAEKLTGRISDAMVVRLIFAYAKIARFRYRRSPETLANIDEFVSRRTGFDRRAAQHRLHLIAENDPRPDRPPDQAAGLWLTGVPDPIVPWPWVRHWLKKNCPALRDYKLIWSGDHNVLSTTPRESTRQVLEWMALPETGNGAERN